MSFLDFCTSLLFHPISFTDTYFKEGRGRPEFKEHLQKVLYTVVIARTLVQFVLNLVRELVFLAFLEDTSRDVLILLFMRLIVIVIVIGVMYLILPDLYRLNCWLFQNAVYGAGGHITREEGVDIALYLTAFSTLVSLLTTLVSLLVPVISFLAANVWLSVVFRMFLLITSLIVFYIDYCIIKKLISVRAWLVLLLRFIITIGVVVAVFFSFCLIALHRAGMIYFLLSLIRVFS